MNIVILKMKIAASNQKVVNNDIKVRRSGTAWARLLLGALLVVGLLLGACEKEEVLTMDTGDAESESSDPMQNKGIGPVKELQLGALNPALAQKGKAVFTAKCQACHTVKEKVVGPAIQGVTKRRSPEWIMNMILNTNEMVEKDPIVKSMVAEYMTKMTFQDVSKEDARAILEYFRTLDQ